MNERRPGYIALSISEGAFDSDRENEKSLDTIIRQIKRNCIANSVNIAGFGVTSHSARGTVRATPFGRKTDPEFEIEPPHQHHVFATDAYATTAKIIKDYLKKTFGKNKIYKGQLLERNLFWIDELEDVDDVRYWTAYCVEQALCIRKINHACSEDFINHYCIDMILAAEKSNVKVGSKQPIYPTYSHLIPNMYKTKNDVLLESKLLNYCSQIDGGVDILLAN